jgi:hypothetical protein
MTSYEFTLRIRLPEANPDPEHWADRLHEAGCDDATIGTGRHGFIGLMFARAAPSAAKAIASAVRDVRRAIPGAQVVAAEPDRVNLADLARLTGFSRQNLRKYAIGQMRTVRAVFPPPAVSGPESYWRLAEVGIWMGANTSVTLAPGLIDLAWTTRGASMQRFRRRRPAGAAA